ncbi:hypothetical protein L249_6965 [Ophiocordyceps polyrhachis-furcata BCC 54312]|uniref:Nucleoporin NSP1 n=1 Tax=Ophiocordyceps polyrhachis-furcata BCC 54312 TaxID=1330021 RepID=A0A367LLK8_9HYPO|nr:hypothetical protein L249_6965 [Ophiocordyceps polyrhachis-furcata BCC 54312]
MAFKFGPPGSSSGPSNATTTSAPETGNLFGAAPAAPQGVFNFGNVGNTAAATNAAPPANTGLFSGQQQQQQQQAAGGDAQKAAASPSAQTSIFGANALQTGGGSLGGNSSTPLFGAAASTTSTPATSTQKPGGLFGNMNKPATNLFGAPAAEGGSLTPGSGLFGSQKNDALTAAASTPAKPMFSLASTTPAGAPPADSSEPAAASSQTTSQSLFGPAKTSSDAPAVGESFLCSKSVATPAVGLFGNTGSGSFPSPFPASTQNSTAPPSTGASLFGAKATAPEAAAGATTTGGGLFGNVTATSTASTSGATQAPSGGLFNTPAPTATTSAAAPTMPSTSTSGGLFGSTQPSASATAAKTSSSLFGAAATLSTSQPASTAGATETAGGLFGTKTATEGADKEKDKAQDGQGAKPSAQNGTPSALGASTSGPTSQIPRLKNKTMEDIITRWASDLAKYQKDFKEQATVVSTWDRNLVDNGEKIQKLYLDTFEAERASHEIERQLVAVESQQDELEAWLDRYESEVQDMMVKQVGLGEQLAGPDQERERTYKLAEKLTQQLDEKSRDLSKMVKEINDISGNLTKGTKAEDPLSQIVRLLNGHLTQLQWIDAHSAALQAKVAAAQKSSGALNNHYAGIENDAAESFYRSYMGRR